MVAESVFKTANPQPTIPSTLASSLEIPNYDLIVEVVSTLTHLNGDVDSAALDTNSTPTAESKLTLSNPVKALSSNLRAKTTDFGEEVVEPSHSCTEK